MFPQEEAGDSDSKQEVEKLMPQKVKKRRKIQTEDGVIITFLLDSKTKFSKFNLVFINNKRQ